MKYFILLCLFAVCADAAELSQVRKYLSDGGTISGILDASKDTYFQLRRDAGESVSHIAAWSAETLGVQPSEAALPSLATANAAWQTALDNGPTSQAMFKSLQTKLAAYNVTVTSRSELPTKLDNIKAAWTTELDADATALQSAATLATYKSACNTALQHIRNQNDIRDLLIGILGREAAGL